MFNERRVPSCVSMVEMLEPHKGRLIRPQLRIGRHVRTIRRTGVGSHEGQYLVYIAIYGQESNYVTWRLAKMNLAVRGIDADIRWNSEGSFHKDELPDLRADYILANPPFNISDWGGERLRDGPPLEIRHSARRQCQLRLATAYPPSSRPQRHGGRGAGQRFHVLQPVGRGRHPQGDDRGRRGRLHDRPAGAVVLFHPDPRLSLVSWRRTGRTVVFATGRDEILFIDARKLGVMVDRTRREFEDADIAKIADTYHRWREGQDYEDVPGFCKSAELDAIKGHGHVLTPGRYVGAKAQEDDGDCRSRTR